MKIVAVHNDFRVYYPPRLLALQNVLEARADQFFVIELFKESIDYGFSDNDKSGFTHHEFLFPTWRGVSMTTIARKLEERLDQIAPDVVICGAIAFPAGATAVRWAKKRGKAVISMDNAQKDSFERGKLNHFVKKRIFKYVDAFVCPSEKWDDTLAYWGFAKEQLFYGLNTADNRFWGEDPQVDVGGEDFFLSVGRLVPKKNHIDILEAYKQYSDRVGDKARSLVIIGGGPEKERLDAYVATHALSKVRIIPFLALEGLREYYHRAGAFIIASNKEETWGIVVNEAMSGGCAVIASDQTGCASTLVDPRNGYIFPTGNVDELTARMLRYDALTAQQREAMGEASKRRASLWGLDRFCNELSGAITYATTHKHPCRNPFDRLILQFWKGRLLLDKTL